MVISVADAYRLGPDGKVDMDLFKQFAAQQEASLANMRANPPQLSEPLQTLQANPELLYQAVDSVASQGIAPGTEFQSMVEDYAIQNPTIPEPVAPQPTTQVNNVSPAMMGFANIMANTYDLPDAGTEGELTPQFTTGANTIADMAKYTTMISPSLYETIIDAQYGDTNEDKAPNRVFDVLQAVFKPNRSGVTSYDVMGGNEALLKAYEQLGVTGGGTSYADKQTQDLFELAEQYGLENSSINMDGTGGQVGTKSYTGPNAFQDAMSDMFSAPSIPLTPLTALMALGKAVNSYSNMPESTDVATKMEYAINDALGFGPGGPGTDGATALSGTYGNLGETDRSLVD